MKGSVMAVACSLLCGLGGGGCREATLPPVGNVLLYVDTDAPIPAAPGTTPEPLGPMPLFDSLQIDLYGPGATSPCDACGRQFAVDQSQQAQGISFAVVATPGEEIVADVRLFRAESAAVLGIQEASSLEAWVVLPAIPSQGQIVRSVFLPTDSVGAPAGSLVAPVTPDVMPTLPARFGTWPQAARTPCAGQPRPTEVCVPGGAFWMGSASVNQGLSAANDERIVVLSPFFLDATEVDVASLRAGPADFTQIGAWSGEYQGVNADDWCTFTTGAGPHDALPASCISWQGARTYCQGHGADLPTEAQLEYVLGGLSSSDFVWGGLDPPPACSDAVWGLGTVFDTSADGTCMPSSSSHPTAEAAIGYPLATSRSSFGRDVLSLPSGKLTDLSGNVAEWALDWFQAQTEPCWSTAGVYANPLCATQGTLFPDQRSVRGASFVSPAAELSAARKDGIDPTTITPVIGFRCARSG
jgi:formylglycine-generating enzyme